MIIYGMDIGGTKIEVAIFDDEKLLHSWRVGTPIDDYKLFLNTIKMQVLKADNISGEKAILGIGIPGIVDKAKRHLSSNIPCINGRNVQKDIEQLIERKIAFENDCRCFALSEATTKENHKYKIVFGLILGTGNSGGLCIDGSLYQSLNNHVGEVGHISIPAMLKDKYDLELVRCGCGLYGCVEHYVSGSGLTNLYYLFYGQKIDSEDIFSGYRNNHVKCTYVIRVFIDLLGFCLASIIKHYDPDLIIIGGGLSNVDELFTLIPNAIDPYLFSTITPPQIVKAKFGDSSGIRGAATLAKQTLLR